MLKHPPQLLKLKLSWCGRHNICVHAHSPSPRKGRDVYYMYVHERERFTYLLCERFTYFPLSIVRTDTPSRPSRHSPLDIPAAVDDFGRRYPRRRNALLLINDICRNYDVKSGRGSKIARVLMRAIAADRYFSPP